MNILYTERGRFGFAEGRATLDFAFDLDFVAEDCAKLVELFGMEDTGG